MAKVGSAMVTSFDKTAVRRKMQTSIPFIIL
jgi:hypothetical protein